MLWLLAGGMIAITRRWEHKPWCWLGIRPLSWRALLLAGVLGVALGMAVPVLTVAVNRLLPPSEGGTVESAACQRGGLVAPARCADGERH